MYRSPKMIAASAMWLFPLMRQLVRSVTKVDAGPYSCNTVSVCYYDPRHFRTSHTAFVPKITAGQSRTSDFDVRPTHCSASEGGRHA
nr:hypothetical protein CFP56_37348 [Quercus suber]